MDEDRKQRMQHHRSKKSGGAEEAVRQQKDGGCDLRVADEKLGEKDHPCNEKSNERWMNFCPEDTRKEIEELEDRARALRRMLRRLQSDTSGAMDKRLTPQPSQAPKPSSADLDVLVCCSQIREEDEDSLDRELIGDDE